MASGTDAVAAPGRDLWNNLEAAYVEVWRRRETAAAADSLTTAVAEQVRLAMMPVEQPSAGPVGEADSAAHVRPRVNEWVVRASRVLIDEGSSARPVGFDRLRDRLEAHGFSRADAWGLCVALRRVGVVGSEPNRPYLDGRGQRLAERLLSATGLRGRSVEDLEAGLMIAGETRLASAAPGQRLDAEVLTQACRQLGRVTAGGQRT